MWHVGSRWKQDRQKEFFMGVFLQRRGDGWDKRWKGKWHENGRTFCVTLNLWRGTPPPRGEKKGDERFEESRVEALVKLKEAMAKRRDEPAVQRLELVAQEARMRAALSRKPRKVLLSDLVLAWDKAPHKKAEISKERRDRIHSVIRRFVKFMSARFPSVRLATDVEADHFSSFLDDVEKTGCTGRTWNDVLDILREVIRQTRTEGPGYTEYLSLLPHKDQTPVSRDPLTDEELAAIFAAAQEVDRELYPVLLAAVATGMRRGDLALLKWESVDTAEGFISCRTRKTKKLVEVPIDDPLLAMLEAEERSRDKENPFVWPGVAQAYKEAPKSLNRRLNKILAAAGFSVPVYPSRNHHGKKVDRPAPGVKGGTGRCTVAEGAEGQTRRFRASKVGWHSFRTSFVTAALSRGVDPGVVMSLTGHTSVRTLFRHYDQRSMKTRRQQTRQAYFGTPDPARHPALPAGEQVEVAEVAVAKPLPDGLAGLLEAASPEQLAAVAALLGAARK